MKPHPLKILFLGLGSIGRWHARLIHEHWPEHELVAIRSRQGQQKKSPSYIRGVLVGLGCDVVFVCTPTFMHIEEAKFHADRSRHLFIEKPIGDSVKGLNYLSSAVENFGRTAYVAYPMRFHPKISKIRQLVVDHSGVRHARFVCSSWLPSWRPRCDPKFTYSASEAMGGGILLDMSHHAYFAEQLFGKVTSLVGTRARLTDITTDTDDSADLILRHESGTVSNIHVDFITEVGGCDRVVLTFRDGTCKRIYLELTKRQTDAVYLAQLEYFFDNLDNPRLDGNLESCVPLFKKLIKVREENPV